jgi:hypothetical protein
MANDSQTSARAYWADQMEQGYELVQKIMAFEVQECGEGFASLPDAVAADGVEIQFSTSKIAGELDRVFYIRESLVRDVLAIGREMNERGWILKIEDGYRSLAMQKQLGSKAELFDAIRRHSACGTGLSTRFRFDRQCSQSGNSYVGISD